MYDELTDLIGCFATLLTPLWGCTEATVVGSDGNNLILRLRNRRVVTVDRNDALVYQ